MAWVETLPSGKHRGGYRDAAGRKRSRTFAHKAAARRWAQDGEDAVARGHDPDAGKLTFGAWADRWTAARVVEPTTASNDKARMRLIREEFGQVPLERMSTLDIQGWVKRLGVSGMSPGTVKGYHRQVSAMLNAAVVERILQVNPARFVQLPTSPRGREVYLTPAEVERLADVMRDPYATITRMLPYMGMRWGELIGLRVSDVDMLRRTAQVRQVVQQVGAVRTIKPYPKTLTSFRTVPIPSGTVDVLAAYLAGHPRGRDDLIFVNTLGDPLSRTYNRLVFKDALVKAKIGKAARPHDLRHSGASWLAQTGVPIFAISKWLGHSSIQTTMRYSHAAEGAHDEVRKAFDAVGRGTDHGTPDTETGRSVPNVAQS